MNKYLQRLSVLLVASGLLTGSAMAQGALRNEVIKPLAAAQEAIKNNQNDQALGLLRDALAVPQLTANEKNMISRTQAVAALRAQKWAIAIEALESLVTSADVPQADKRPLLESLINASLQTKDDARVVKWARQYLQDGGANPAVHLALLQALAASGQHAEVVSVMLAKIRLDASTAKKTPEPEFRTLAVSYRQLKDDAGYMSTLKRLVNDYPTKAYWVEVLTMLKWYTFLIPQPGRYVGHNPLARLAMFFGFMALSVFMIVTGFALYGEGSQMGSWQEQMFGWVIPLFGQSQDVHTWHRMGMWAMIIFVVLHVYAAIREDIMGRQSVVSTMISGFRTFKD